MNFEKNIKIRQGIRLSARDIAKHPTIYKVQNIFMQACELVRIFLYYMLTNMD